MVGLFWWADQRADQHAFVTLRLTTVLIMASIAMCLIWGANMLGYSPESVVSILDFTLAMLLASVTVPMPTKYYLPLMAAVDLYLFLGTPLLENAPGTFGLLEVSVLILSITCVYIGRLSYERTVKSIEMTDALKRQRENLEALVLEKTNALKQREDAFSREVIGVLSSVIEHYDAYTKGHSEKVAHLSEIIAREMGYDLEFQKEVYWAGLIHDIGKIKVSKELLNKPGYLTNEEYRLLQQHPVYGYDMIKESQPLKNVSKYVFHHHEYYNGKGYPMGLKGDSIPRASQILCVADAWDAMRSERVYRSALSVTEARAELQACRGEQFSPDIVDVFLSLEESFI
jgi:putative nucleotidyltransferase with HDIG domain